jgi:hypothetical protein
MSSFESSCSKKVLEHDLIVDGTTEENNGKGGITNHEGAKLSNNINSMLHVHGDMDTQRRRNEGMKRKKFHL